MAAGPRNHAHPEPDMFTTEPSLASRIERLFADTPKVDPHTHLKVDRLGAPDLDALMAYHWVRTELRSVGMPEADLDPALPPEERVRRSIPYLARMRNTAMSWCLHRIFRDLYDFHDPCLTEHNYRALYDKVIASGSDPAWGGSVLRERCNISTIVTSLGNRGVGEGPDDFYYMLDAHYLFCPGVATDLEPFFAGHTSKSAYGEALTRILGEFPSTSERMERMIGGWLDHTLTGRVRFTNTFLPIEHRFHPPDATRVDFLLGQASRGGELSDGDVDALARAVSWQVLKWHHENKKAVQIAVGAEYFICDGKSIPRSQESWTSEMAPAFHHFRGARFDLMMAADALSQDVAVLARQFPNVYAAGYWWHNFFPPLIERIAGLRAQVTPMSKYTGFLSDAYYAEWTYGKMQVVKKATAQALAHLVEAGFYEEEDLPALLRQTLHDTPRDLYDLRG